MKYLFWSLKYISNGEAQNPSTETSFKALLGKVKGFFLLKHQ